MRVLIAAAASTILLVKSPGAERLDLALSDGTIAGTQDGGRRWKATFRP